MRKEPPPLTWITNHPKSIKGMWPRRAGVKYHEGLPKASESLSCPDLIRLGLVGVYVEIPPEEYYKLPLARTPDELKELELKMP